MSIYQRLSLPVVVVMAGLLLSGCAPAAEAGPSGEPTAKPTASATPEAAQVASLVVGATGFSLVDDAGAQLESVPYSSDPEAAVALLTEAFGTEPVRSDRQSEPSCVTEAKLATWDPGFELRFGIPEGWIPAGQLFELESTAPAVGDVAIETPAGVSVGDPVDSLLQGLPAEQVGEPAQTDIGLIQWADYEVGSGAPSADPNEGSPDYWGASGRAVDGTVDVLTAPHIFENLC
jgi:hypothetical protein